MSATSRLRGVAAEYQDVTRPARGIVWNRRGGEKVRLERRCGLHFGTGCTVWEATVDGQRDPIYGRAYYNRGERVFCAVEKGEIVPQTQAGAFRTWRAMRLRCFNPKTGGYANYGGRGISVYAAWLPSAYAKVKPTSNALEPCRKAFGYFLADCGIRPSGMSLDRTNVNGNYEPSNVEWIANGAQAYNKRRYTR